MNKTQTQEIIYNVLCKHGLLTLTEIYNLIDVKHKPVVLYHLKELVYIKNKVIRIKNKYCVANDSNIVNEIQKEIINFVKQKAKLENQIEQIKQEILILERQLEGKE